MFGIGAFARVAQVSVRTLHHYDDIGLLPPAQVDPQTGYRWYRADQLQRLNRILALRDLGLPLTEVRKVVDDEVSVDELRGMLRLRQAEARDHMTAEAERLSRVEARLRQIETEGRVGDYDVVVKPVEAQHVALVDTTATSFGNATLGPIFGRLFGELYGELDRVGVAPAGPVIALYEESEVAAAPIKVMAGVPIEETDDVTSDRIEVADVPAIPRAATTIHRGSMAHVEEAYQALLRWAEETGEQIDGFSREIYLECVGDPETWVTELQFALHQRTDR
ncbi:MAG TPA: MerR family transcriptional regulator [Acidimicrobiia bacterium]|nr:MerR family transcriptional regulator [Acidimicrobiia bacterium]